MILKQWDLNGKGVIKAFAMFLRGGLMVKGWRIKK
jgi:hypothetical protein